MMTDIRMRRCALDMKMKNITKSKRGYRVYACINSFKQYSLSTNYVPVTVLDARDTPLSQNGYISHGSFLFYFLPSLFSFFHHPLIKNFRAYYYQDLGRALRSLKIVNK